jgi:hypothetical protein
MTDDTEDLQTQPGQEADLQQQNSAAEENKTETKPAVAPKGHLSKDDWVALGRREEDWQSPDEFTERQGELKKTVKQLQAEVAAAREAQARTERITNAQLKRIRDKEVRDLQQRQFEAAAVADVEAVAKLRGEEAQLLQSYAEEDRRPAGLLPETTAWMQSNPWFQSDLERTEAALGHYSKAETLLPHHPDPMVERQRESQRLGYVDKKLGGSGSGAGNGTAALSGMPDVHGGTRRAEPARKNSAATLPADAQRQGQRFIKSGLFKTMDEYAKSYYEDA